jgi:hypothetical protein
MAIKNMSGEYESALACGQVKKRAVFFAKRLRPRKISALPPDGGFLTGPHFAGATVPPTPGS